MDFKTNWLMYGIAAFVILFVVAESVFFIVKAWKRAGVLGMDKQKLKDAATSSALFTIAPAISILATVIALTSALGIVLPWIRLSVIGNIQYETVAAEAILNQLGGSISREVTSMKDFSAIAWVMTIGCVFPLILLPFLCKTIQKKLGNVVKNEKTSALADVISAAALIGIIAAFVCRAINGKSADGTNDAGFLSIATMLTSIIVFMILDALAKKFKLTKFENFVMPIAMFIGMGMAIVLTNLLPASVVGWTWWN